jgi:hypothetical protein
LAGGKYTNYFAPCQAYPKPLFIIQKPLQVSLKGFKYIPGDDRLSHTATGVPQASLRDSTIGARGLNFG